MKRSLSIAALGSILMGVGPVLAAQEGSLPGTNATLSRLILAAVAGASVTLAYVIATRVKLRRRKRH